MLKRVLNTELEKKVFEDEMMEKLSVVPAEYEVTKNMLHGKRTSIKISSLIATKLRC